MLGTDRNIRKPRKHRKSCTAGTAPGPSGPPGTPGTSGRHRGAAAAGFSRIDEAGFSLIDEAGFSLIEMLVTLAVTALLVVGILGVFDFNNKVAHVQTQVADMQQSLRVGQYEMVRYIRMAGRGGVPADRAVEVRNNVGEAGAQETILVGEADSPLIVKGSDVVTVRGVFSSPVYQINYVQPDQFIPPAGPGDDTGTVVIRSPGPTGIPQDMTAIHDMKDTGTKEALLLVSPLTDAVYAVVECEGVDIEEVAGPGGTVTTATLQFRVRGSDNSNRFAALNPGGAGAPFPLTNAISLGILDEYRFYLRDKPPPAGAAGSALAPKLSIAHVFPGTERPYKNVKSNLELDLADNILDLQVALGMDRDNDGVISAPPAVAAAADEWLYDDAADAAFAGPLAYVRVNTLARTDRPDRDFRTVPIQPMEDRVYKPSGGDLNDPASMERFYRRRVLQTIVDLRNLG